MEAIEELELSAEEKELILSRRAEQQDIRRLDRRTLESTIDPKDYEEGYIWVQNLSDGSSNFSDVNGSFRLEGYGLMGSLAQIDVVLTRSPFLVRAEQRGKVRWLDHEAASEILTGLVDLETPDSAKHLRKYLEEGAAEQTSRYLIDVPDEAEAKRSISADEVWDAESGAEKSSMRRTVQRQSQVTEALDPDDVLTDKEYGEL